MAKKTSILLFFSLMLLNVLSIEAQKVFSLNCQKEALILGAGAGSLLLSQLIAREKNGLSPTEIAELNRENVWKIDRFAIDQKWAPAAKISDIAFGIGFTSTAWLMTEKTMRNDFFIIGFMAFETALLTTGITYLTKNLSLRTRPYVYNVENTLFDKQDIDARHSFFSGHTSISSAMCVFTASTLGHYFTNSKAKKYMWLAALAIPSTVASMRILSGKHFLTDVVVGACVGTSIGLLVPYLHASKTKALSLKPTLNGFALSYRF